VQASGSDPTYEKNVRNRVLTYSEDGGDKFLRNFVTLLSDYTCRIPKYFLCAESQFPTAHKMTYA